MKKFIAILLVAMMALSLVAINTSAADDTVDENGNYIPESVTNFGFSNFGDINKPTNVLDGDENTCTGSNYNEGTEQGIIFNLKKAGYVDSIFIQCKEEGTTSHEDGTTRGTYSIYAVNGDETTLIAENVPAVTGTNGGHTVTLPEAVQTKSIKVVVTSWQGDCWACIADISVHHAEGTSISDAIADANGNLYCAGFEDSGFAGIFGTINAAENVLDGDANTVTGLGFSEGMYLTYKFYKTAWVDQIFLQCKNEGAPEEGLVWGLYDIYAIKDGVETKIASDVPAIPGESSGTASADLSSLNGEYGKTVTLDKAVEADAIKVVITAWYGTNNGWACIADMTVHQGEAPVVETGDATVVIAVLAVVALFGTAVIVKKVHG